MLAKIMTPSVIVHKKKTKENAMHFFFHLLEKKKKIGSTRFI